MSRYSKYGETIKKEQYMNTKRRDRQKKAVSLRWKIKQDKDGMGIFTTHQYIPGAASWMENGGSMEDDTHIMNWADFYFMSKKPIREGIYYNTAMITLAKSIVEKIEDEVYDKVESMLTEKEKADDLKKSTSLPRFEKIKGSKNFRMIHHKRPTFVSLNNKTRLEAQNDLTKEAMENLWEREAVVSFKKQYDYRSGVGLAIVANTMGINLNSVIEAVEEFWDGGEVDLEYTVDIAPHIPAIRGMLYQLISVHDRMIAKDKDEAYTPIDWDALLTDQEKRFFHNGSVPLK